MNTKVHKAFLTAGLSLLLTAQMWGYAYAGATTNSIAAWLPGTIPMQIKLGTGTVTLRDGTNYSTSVQEAMNTWNAQLGTVQFAPVMVQQSSTTDPDHTISEIVFNSTVEGTPFGAGVLAITLSYTRPSIHQRTESDIFFNIAFTWDSYRGTLLQTPIDIRRVALHELGHVLGLTHPNDVGQTVTAVMNSSVSNQDTLAPDDIAGAQGLYRAPGDIAPAVNDNFANAIPITLSNNTAQVTGSTYYATKQVGEPAHGDDAGAHSVWWKWTAPSSGSITITTNGSYFDTQLGVYTGSSVSALTLIAKNDEVSSGISYSTVAFNAIGGTTYMIVVDGWQSQSGFVLLGLTFILPSTVPSITSQPLSQSVRLGQGATFSVAASGVPAPTYQWRKNAVDISGATGTSYGISSVLMSDAGSFTVVATNSAGSAVSNVAVLTVRAAAMGVDFNADGKPDLLWQNSITGERAIWLMSGTNFLGSSTLGIFPREWTIAATGDFNGDGKSDIIWSNSITGERAIWLMNGTNFLASSTLGIFPLEWTVAATGDFNADGKPDIIWSNSITGERAIWLMNGTNLLASSTLGIFPLEWTVAATGDFNGDGKPDIIWSNSITGERAIWLMNGTNFLASSTLGIFPLEWTVAGTADFNADGKPDIIWSNSITGERALWLMNGTAFLGSSTLGIFPLEWTVKN